MRKFHMRRGMTLVETCIALVLMSFVVLIAVNLLGLTTRGFWGTNLQITMAQEDSAFAAQLNETIQESTTAFTVPKSSFTEEKLTAGWHYLGLMDHVNIPANCSRTGREISSAQALVYISYMGTTAPASVPDDCNLLSNADGYFCQKILGHAFTDPDGLNYDYSLVFKPTSPVNTAAQSIIYDFTSNITDASGNLVGSGTGIDIDTMLNALNSIQVVYKGSTSNPAVALAFRPDFMPTYSVGMINTEKPAATIAIVLDLSDSMNSRFNGTPQTRVAALKEAATSFVEQLSVNDRVNVILIPFSTWAARGSNYSSGRTPSYFVYNACNDKDELIAAINSLRGSGMTNVGDGLRVAYYQLEQLKNSGATMGSEFVILMTDGLMNTISVNRSTGGLNYSNFYTGSAIPPPARIEGLFYNEVVYDYMRLWANKIISEHHTTNYLISLDGGMSGSDKVALESVFGTTAFDVTSLTEFNETFDQINTNINEVMWAFEGPRL